ncbi:PAS domain S-box protein [Niabella aquatica]
MPEPINTNLFQEEEKQALFAAIVNSSDDAIISKTLKGVITSWNASAERIFGYTGYEVLGKHISLIIPEERLPEEDFIIGKITKGEKIQHFETIRKTKENRLIPISLSISPIRNSRGVIIGASKIARDITAQKKAEEKQNILAAIVNNSDDAIISKTLQGIITSWNKAAEIFFEYTESEAVGKHISLIIPPDRYEEETHIINEICKGNNVSHFETFRVSKSGKLIPISLTISPVLNDKGEVIGASKIARDISEKIKIQQEKDHLYNEVKILSNKKDEFIAAVTHELKTPVTALSGSLQILKRYIPLDDKGLLIVERCLKQVDKVCMLINDLLDFSRAQAGLLQLRMEPFDLAELIKESIDFFKDETNHTFKLDCIKAVWLKADRLRIEQVLVNLLGNAVKYSPDGGVVEVIVKEQAGTVSVSVKDDGIGIDKESLDKMFTRFYRAVSNSSNIPGLGMGLYISKEIISRHNGAIHVESKAGKGSIFSFTLPCGNEV